MAATSDVVAMYRLSTIPVQVTRSRSVYPAGPWFAVTAQVPETFHDPMSSLGKA